MSQIPETNISTTKCPKCAKDNRMGATFCRFCGQRIASEAAIENSAETKKNNENNRTHRYIIVVFLSATFALWLVSFYLVYHNGIYREMLIAWISILTLLLSWLFPNRVVQIGGIVFNLVFSVIWYICCYEECGKSDLPILWFSIIMYILLVIEVMLTRILSTKRIFNSICGIDNLRSFSTSINSAELLRDDKTEKELIRLKRLLEENLITQDDYDMLKQKTLGLDKLGKDM